MSSPDVVKRLHDLATQLTEPQRTLLLDGGSDDVQAGVGTWLTLQKLGLLDSDFETTPLGLGVITVLLNEQANAATKDREPRFGIRSNDERTVPSAPTN